MFSKCYSATLDSLDAIIIQVEADVSDGLPLFEMVGVLASEVRESKERVKVSLKNSGYILPPKRVTINLSPADIKKAGSGFDLSIALALLSASGMIPQDNLKDVIILGELSLDGRVNPINGVLSYVTAAKENGYRRCLVPKKNSREGASVSGIDIIPVASLAEAVNYILKIEDIQPCKTDIDEIFNSSECITNLDFSDIKGQVTVKRALEIAVAGRHNILMVGAPGSGKTMLAKRIPGIMPKLSLEESLEITKIYSISGNLEDDTSLMTERPFRAPHHSTTTCALVGGGRFALPGEISLATHGVLFLDELPEFKRNVIEVLRQPLEEKKIIINRINATSVYPADFMLVAAMNSCPCGNYPDRMRCICTAEQLNRYRAKISQPLLDRIDLCIETFPIEYKDITCNTKEESSAEIRRRIQKVHELQKERYKNEKIKYNANLSVKEIEKYCSINEKSKKIIELAFKKYSLSARGYHKILKVARTIADLEMSEVISDVHISEAITYRSAWRQ